MKIQKNQRELDLTAHIERILEEQSQRPILSPADREAMADDLLDQAFNHLRSIEPETHPAIKLTDYA